jgi:signal peptidase II
MSKPPRVIDVHVGSATDGRVPISVASRSLGAGLRQWVALLLVRSQLALGQAVEVTSFFELHHVRNTGIAFGLFPGSASPVTILTGLAVIWMLAYFVRSGARHPLLPVALGFLIGGSMSNLVDRVRQGFVTDFLDPKYWPAFNLGDVFITVGVIVLITTFVLGERRPRIHRTSAGSR